MKHLSLLFSAFLINQITFTSHALTQKTESYATDEIMLSLGNTLQNLYPIVFSEKKYQDPKNQPEIQSDVEKLIKIFTLSEKHFNQRSISYKISYNVLLQHLKDTQTTLDKKSNQKANEMLKAIPVMCAACHTQDGSEKKNFLGLTRAQFDSDYSYADFCFSTRDYKKAIFYYDRFLTTGSHYHSEQHTEQALIRLMLIHIQMNKDLNLAAAYLNEYVAFIKESPNIKNKLLTWVKNIQLIDEKLKQDYPNSKPITFNKLEKFTQQYFSSSSSKKEADNLPSFVVLRGMIYHYLNAGNKISESEMPFLLYWLAKCDKATNLNDYAVHADMYLKECYINYPNNSWAKACKKEFESFATLALLRN